MKSRVLLSAGVAIVIGLLSLWLLSPASRLGTALTRTSYDWSQEMLAGTPLSNSPVVIVYLDIDSYRAERQNPVEPWDRTLHARLLDRLTAAGAKAVVFDIIFDAATPGSVPDQEFTAALRSNGHAVLAGEISRSSRSTATATGVKSVEYSLPAAQFLNAAAAWGTASLQPDGDFVVRRYFPGFSVDQPSLAAAATTLAGVPKDSHQRVEWLRYYGGPVTIPHVSYSAALRTNEVGNDFFRDKIVLVGARPMAGMFLERKDEFRSPLAVWGDNELFMPAVEVQATQMLNLVRGDFLRRLPAGGEMSLLLVMAVLISVLLFSFRPLPAAGVALGIEAAVLGMAAAGLMAGQTWFPWMIVAAVQVPGALVSSVLWQSLEWYRQRRRFEAQRRADEAKIREQASLIEKAQDAILVQKLSGEILYANPSAERLYGWNLAELRGAARAIPVPEKARQAALATGEWLGELEQSTRDGRKITVASRCTLIQDEAGKPKSLLFINTDVTEKKRLEQEFFRAQRAESIGSLASGMAHDLNNAFAPILMGLQLLQRERRDDETQRMLSVMEQNTHRGADMVRQVLLFCRGSDSERRVLSLGRLLREMEQMARQTFPRAINVAVLAPGDLWPVLGNGTQLHQVLLNLCVNARDAMPRGGELTLAADNVALNAEEAAEIPQGRPGQFVMILVSDTGTGIPVELLPKIFEPFFTTKPVEQGTGLGLSTVARIVRQHQGFLHVKSEAARGTTFEIYLPRATAAVNGENKSIHGVQFPRGQGELILVADDEQAVVEMVALTLGEQGYRVVTASNGAEAMAKVEASDGTVRLVLLDTDMPVMNGPQTVVLLREKFPNLPVVLMSGELDGDAQGAETHTLAKPFQLHELLHVVTTGLQGR